MMPAKGNRLFVLLAFLVFVVIFVVENINERFWLNDFEVYYLASKSFITGSQVYGIPYGEDTGLYKYSPVLLLPFSLFTLLPYYAASVLQFILIGICTVFAALFVNKIVGQIWIDHLNTTNTRWILPLALLLVLNHLFRELHLGNLNMTIVCLLCVGIYTLIRKKEWLAAIPIGACILIKPYLVVLLLPLFVFRKYRTVFGSVGFIAGCVLLMAVVSGFSKTAELHKDWFAAMTAHGTYLFSNHTFAGILRYYTGWDADSISQYFLPALILLAYAVFLVIRKRAGAGQMELVLFFYTLLALVPNLFITDTEHFLFSFPLIVLCLWSLFQRRTRTQLFLFILFALLYGANSSDFFGHDLADKFELMGLLGIGNLGLIVLSNYLFLNKGSSVVNEHKPNLVF